MRIRPANPSDLDQIADLFDQYRRFYGQPADLALAKRFMSARLRNGDSRVLVAAADNGALTGFAQLYPSLSSVSAAPVYVLNDLYVAAAYRRRGVGRALLEAGHTFARQQGAIRLSLSTAVSNQAAQALYESLGWVRDQGFYHYNLAVDDIGPAAHASDDPWAIDSADALRQLYPQPKERAVRKQLSHLDRHCIRFIELSPFAVIATGNAGLDASPRGGEPGFIRIVDERTLWIPDSPGNNRLDSLTNIIATGRIGLLFLIPGVDETLRINGRARVSADPAKTGRFATEQRTPKVVIEVGVEEAYLHCAKALMRSKLWADDSRQERSVLPTMGQMINDQVGMTDPVETQAEMVARYQHDL